MGYYIAKETENGKWELEEYPKLIDIVDKVILGEFAGINFKIFKQLGPVDKDNDSST